MMARLATIAALVASAATPALAAWNDLGRTPPMGWRSWNQFGLVISQDLILQQAQLLRDTSRPVWGKSQPTSLADLGYSNIGVDDGWQLCGSYGPKNYTFHTAAGFPVVNTSMFPDMLGMTNAIHALNLTAGWYGNNCNCHDHCDLHDPSCFAGDVAAWYEFGYDSVKYDGCGTQHNMTEWGTLLEGTGRPYVIENCGNDVKPVPGQPLTGPDAPPYHLYRISTDIRPTYGSAVNNAQSIRYYQENNITGPGCWATSDMLMSGVTVQIEDGFDVPVLSPLEGRSHFYLWAVISNPLALSLDLSNASAVAGVWAAISNVEAIAINQAWAGSPGGVLAEAGTIITLHHCTWVWAGDQNCSLPLWQVWYKPMPGGAAALLAINHDLQSSSAGGISIPLAAIPGLACGGPGEASCSARDVVAHADLPSVTGAWLPPVLASHDVSFVLLTPQ